MMYKLGASRDERHMTLPERGKEFQRRLNWALKLLKEVAKLTSVDSAQIPGKENRMRKSPKVWKKPACSGVYKYSHSDETMMGRLPRKGKGGKKMKWKVGFNRSRQAKHEKPCLPRCRTSLHQRSYGTPLRILCRGVTWLDLHFLETILATVWREIWRQGQTRG